MESTIPDLLLVGKAQELVWPKSVEGEAATSMYSVGVIHPRQDSEIGDLPLSSTTGEAPRVDFSVPRLFYFYV